MIRAGLILEGGGMRGAYTTGVLDGMMDAGLYLDAVYGVSAGAGHACSYLSHQRGRAVRTVTDYLDDPRYASVSSLLRTGDFFGARMVYEEIPQRLLPFDYDAFAASGMRLYAVVTNCRTGQAEYMHIRDARRHMHLVRASSSLPMLSRMVGHEGELYLDGGIADSIPLARSIADGNEKNVVILTRHKQYRKDPSRLGAAMRLYYRKYPALVQAVATRHIRYNQALALVEGEGASGRAFVIRPRQEVKIGRLEKDRSRLTALYNEGLRDLQELLPALRVFLGV